jgi:uncharacterized alpha-E superfamily protein
VISRVADHCFWLGRYLDRTESTARLLQATRTLVFDADVPVTKCWQPLVIVSGEEPAFVERHGAAALGNGEAVQKYMTWSPENFVSLASSARAARECARAIREQLSLDAWEEINELYLWLQREGTDALYWENREEFYRTVRNSTQLALGLVRSTMLHEEPMSFLWLGTMLERANQTARILDMHHHTMEREHAQSHDIVSVALWMSLLRACSGSEAFMKKSKGRITAHSVVSFLLFEKAFPRSLTYCLATARPLLRRIWPDRPVTTQSQTQSQGTQVQSSRPLPGHSQRPSLARLDALLTWLEGQRESFDMAKIHAILTHVVDETSAVCTMISAEIQGPIQVHSQRQSVMPAGELAE